jgi:hypothetical protein
VAPATILIFHYVYLFFMTFMKPANGSSTKQQRNEEAVKIFFYTLLQAHRDGI